MFDHAHALQQVLASEPELRYGFVATSKGALLVEAGQKALLPFTAVVDETLRPRSISSFYEECAAYLTSNPVMVPRLYAQGRSEGVIGPPCPGHLLAVFGVMPSEVVAQDNVHRAKWLWAYRTRVWAAVTRAYSGFVEA